MQSRGLRILVILTLVASLLTVSGLSFGTASVAAAPPGAREKGPGHKSPHPATGVAPVPPGASGVAAPGGQVAYGWGDNTDLQFCNGNFNYNDTALPSRNSYLSGVTAVASGEYHALFLLSDGTVWGCGYDGDGALGNGSALGDDHGLPVQALGVCPSPAPTPPTATACGHLSNIKAIAAGYAHSLALDNDGNVYAWGDNGDGELGLGNATGPETTCTSGGTGQPCSTAPVKVPGLANVTQIAGGDYFSVALKSDGTVWIWGYNQNGELGQGSAVGPETCTFYGPEACSTNPVQVPGLANVVQVATGMDADHVLALKGDGTVWSWGYNANGELGHGTVTANPPICQCEPTPAQVIGPGGTGFLTGVALPDAAHPYYERIGIAYDSSYAVMADGTVYAWGYNQYGELGNGTTTGQPDATGTSCTCWTYPVHVVGPDGTGTLGDIVSFGSGGDDTGYAITSAMTLYAWGYNGYGQLGIGTIGDSSPGLCGCTTRPSLVLNAAGSGPLMGVFAVSASDNDWVFAVTQGQTFTVTVSQDGTGTVTPGTSSYPAGTEASFTATPAAGQVFLGWTLDGQYVGFASPLKFTVSANRTLKAVFVAAPSFSDVASSDADYQAITFLAAMGIINPNGVNGSGQFQPDRDVVRAEMASFVARVFGWQKEFHVNYFPDKCDQNGINCVDDELWNNVAALADYGVVGGYTDQATCSSAGTTTPCYLPRDPVLRVQVISIIARAFIKDTQRPNSFWDRMAADLGQYTNVPNSGTQRSDLTTYRANAGPIPGQADDTAFPDPTGNGSRRFVVEALYEALASWYGTDRVP